MKESRVIKMEIWREGRKEGERKRRKEGRKDKREE